MELQQIQTNLTKDQLAKLEIICSLRQTDGSRWPRAAHIREAVEEYIQRLEDMVFRPTSENAGHVPPARYRELVFAISSNPQVFPRDDERGAVIVVDEAVKVPPEVWQEVKDYMDHADDCHSPDQTIAKVARRAEWDHADDCYNPDQAVAPGTEGGR